MPPVLLSRCLLSGDDATRRYGAAVAPQLGAGDVLLLEGPVGAGKTAFARALIQTRLAVPEDVPSPTFTLVQVYDAGDCEIWHCDLYRLQGPGGVVELGLDEAMERAICLIEWPDRLGDLAPPGALTLRFAHAMDGTAREVTAHGATTWADRVPPCP